MSGSDFSFYGGINSHVPSDPYHTARAAFEWRIPKCFNIGVDVTDKWAAIDPDRTAIVEPSAEGIKRTSFGTLAAQSNQLANLLKAMGIERGDRIGIIMPQRAETVVAHAAIYKLGAIAVPLFSLFGLEALSHRLTDSGARLLICDAVGRAKVETIRQQLPHLEHLLCIDPDPEPEPQLPFDYRLAEMSALFDPVATSADDPALIIYTSGTTGSAKGALHAHRVLLGHLPGVEMSHDGFPQAGDCMWTPADWAWIGGLLDVLLPSLHHGVPVVAHRFDKFDAAQAFQLMADCKVRNVFLPPTALRMLRHEEHPQTRWNLALRSVASGGESLGAELLDWTRAELDVVVNEFYGQTECNMVLSSCAAWFQPRAGAIGKPVPGHDVAVIDESGAVLPHGQEGNIAIRFPDPVMLLGYWRNDTATREKFIGPWLVTGDRGCFDDEGFVHFLGRVDDVITSGGYRIGPAEIEGCLLRHPKVAAAGVVGVPDRLRTEIVTAFVVLKPGEDASDTLAADLQQHVRSQLGGHQYPRTVHFIPELPQTITGKVMRRELRAFALSHKMGQASTR